MNEVVVSVCFQKSYLTDAQKQNLNCSNKFRSAHCIRGSISKNDKEFLQKAFIEMNQENPELRDRIFNGELVIVDPDSHLRVTREAIEVQKTLRH